MYLKKIRLSEKLVSDSVCLEIFALMTNIIEGEIEIIRREHKIFLKSHDKMIMVAITDTGLIYGHNYDDNSPVRSDGQLEAHHLLMETQWRDPEVELPKEGDDIVIKIGKNIITSKYHERDHTGNDYTRPKFWLPAENVVL